MKKYTDYSFKKGTKIVVKKVGSLALWKDFIATKDNEFTSFQICHSDLKTLGFELFPHEDYITFRFHNWFAAVRETDIIKEEI